MNVLVIAELFPPDMGGGSNRAYNVVKGLVSLGHRVTVITVSRDGQYNANEAQVSENQQWIYLASFFNIN